MVGSSGAARKSVQPTLKSMTITLGIGVTRAISWVGIHRKTVRGLFQNEHARFFAQLEPAVASRATSTSNHPRPGLVARSVPVLTLASGPALHKTIALISQLM